MLVVILDNIIFLLAVFTMPFINVSLEYYTLIYLLSNLPGFILILILLHKKFNFRILFSIQNCKWLIYQSYPLFLYVFISNLFQQLDVIFLKYMKDEYTTGIYAVALRLSMPFSIIPSALITTLFPIIVSKYSIGNEKLNFIVKLSFKLLFLSAFSIAAIFTFKAEEITVLIFGEKYFSAGLISSILLWSQIFLFINFFALDLFTAFNYQKYTSRYSFVLISSNILLLLLLVPSLSATGASLAKILSSSIGFIYILFTLRKLKIKFNFITLKLFALFIMLIVIFYLSSKFSLLIYLIIVLTVSIISILFFKIFSKTEIRFILNSK